MIHYEEKRIFDLYFCLHPRRRADVLRVYEARYLAAGLLLPVHHAGRHHFPLVVGVAVVYMFSFFDTYDLIRYLVAGDPKPDGFLLPPDWQNQLGDAKTKMTPKMNKIIGWCLLLTGAYVMYNSVIWPIVESIFVQLGIHWSMIYAINDVIPSIVVAVLLIAFGGRLLGFGKHAHHNDTDDLPPYQG